MNKGGYKILDVSGHEIAVSSATKAVIPGIYDAIEGTDKPLLLSGLAVAVTSSGTTTVTEYGDCFITVTVSSGNFVFDAYGKAFTVTDDDEVYWTAK